MPGVGQHHTLKKVTQQARTCDLVMPVLVRSIRGEMGKPAARSLSPCLNISSSSSCTHLRCTALGLARWPRSEHFRATCVGGDAATEEEWSCDFDTTVARGLARWPRSEHLRATCVGGDTQ